MAEWTGAELELDELLVEVVKAFRDLSNGGCAHKQDMAEVEFFVHGLQGILAMQVLSHDPDTGHRRPLGGHAEPTFGCCDLAPILRETRRGDDMTHFDPAK
jgi:hypothetical protein